MTMLRTWPPWSDVPTEVRVFPTAFKATGSRSTHRNTRGEAVKPRQRVCSPGAAQLGRTRAKCKPAAPSSTNVVLFPSG